jgi:hypothetical protein
MPELAETEARPSFDVKKATLAAPEIDWESISPTFSLESRKLRWYVVEDVMFADPDCQEHLLLLVSINHHAFSTTWLSIFQEQNLLRLPVTIYKEMFFQLEAVVVKNSTRAH